MLKVYVQGLVWFRFVLVVRITNSSSHILPDFYSDLFNQNVSIGHTIGMNQVEFLEEQKQKEFQLNFRRQIN